MEKTADGKTMAALAASSRLNCDKNEFKVSHPDFEVSYHRKSNVLTPSSFVNELTQQGVKEKHVTGLFKKLAKKCAKNPEKFKKALGKMGYIQEQNQPDQPQASEQ